MEKIKHFLMFILFFFFATSLFAKQNTIFSVVSDRSVSSLNQGANSYLKNSDDKIIIRTVSQVMAMNNFEIQKLISSSDIILYTAVFGDIVAKLSTLDYENKTLVALQGDRNLLNLNKDLSKANYENIPLDVLSKKDLQDSYVSFLQKKQKAYPSYAWYLQARAYWDNRGVENISNLFTFLSKNSLDKSTWPKIKELKPIRYFLNANASKTFDNIDSIYENLKKDEDVLVILDNDRADSNLWSLHEILNKRSSVQTISLLSSWGEASSKAVKSLELLKSKLKNQNLSIISLHDFVIGGGEGRLEVLKTLEKLNIPVLKGLKVLDKNHLAYSLSSLGIKANSVHYRISMPELQGIGQIHLLAMNESNKIDEKTGANIASVKLMQKEIDNILKKANKWRVLKQKANKDKKIAIIYYNHPPGRHNIGADNLNVTKSLFVMLQELKKQGYSLGEIPSSEEKLLDLLQEKAVNLPNDKKALKQQANNAQTLSLEDYKAYFKTLPKHIQEEMINGPLAALHIRIENFLLNEVKFLKAINKKESFEAIKDYKEKTISNIHHALDGVRKKSRQRAINLLEQLEDEYLKLLNLAQYDKTFDLQNARTLKNALIDLRIEGLRGWGEAPGIVMAWKDKILVPSVQFGNVILAPQPPRGWELNEELLHANLSFPPTHQYLGFYHYLKNNFKADALIHVGRHSTYEFLPRKSVGLSSSDYPSLIIEDIPSIYPYIVDGVGEGIQAKRRGQAIMIDHLTPPLATTKLYDNLLQLRQLIESAEAAVDDTLRKKAILKLKQAVNEMNLKDELIESMDEELKVRGISFDEIDEEFLLHEVGHYLTHLQEEFMPLGLHTFGKNWNKKAVDVMMESMAKDNILDGQTKNNLIISPKEEMKALINALNGGFVSAGKGNDPIRTKEALPTGRNFYAIDGSLIPSNVGYEIGVKLAQKAIAKKKDDFKKEAVILWASDTIRDEGSMIAFGLELLGVKPIWNSRGILKGLELLPLDKNRAKRYDVVFTSSGLFRDLYGSQLELLNKAVLMALDASYDEIIKKYPVLTLSLDSALKSLGENKKGGNESLQNNMIAANWVKEARDLLKANPNENLERLGQKASLRVFATAPGAYGAGINRLVERSGSWEDRKELADVFIKRMAYAYGLNNEAELSVQSFKTQLKQVENTYLGRASNLYGLIDNNDTFDYLGGLNLAIESLTNKQPKSYVINHSNSNNLKIDTLSKALLSELRGRFFNPQWIKPLMKEGYAGARTMGNEFIEYLWGWQVTSPQIIDNWVWDEVKSVYIDDKLNLGLDEFLSSNHQVHVQTNILAVMLVAIKKEFWQVDEETKKQLASKFVQNIIEKGIPGSGHTHANHPVYDFVKENISKEQASKLENVLKQSRLDDIKDSDSLKRVQELKVEQINKQEIKENSKKQKEQKNEETKKNEKQEQTYIYYIVALALFVLLFGFFKSLFTKRQY